MTRAAEAALLAAGNFIDWLTMFAIVGKSWVNMRELFARAWKWNGRTVRLLPLEHFSGFGVRDVPPELPFMQRYRP